MRLAAYEAALTRLCLDREVDAAALASLGGDPDRWLLYRSMVRGRMARTLRDALPRSARRLGDAFDAAVAGFLDAAPPSSRYLRDLPVEFVAWLRTTPSWADALLASVASHELAVWEVRDAVAAAPAFDALDFERPTVSNPTTRVLWLRHDPTAAALPDAPLLPPRLVFVFRALDTDRVHTAAAPAALAPVLERAIADGAALGPAARALAEAGALSIDDTWVEALVAWLETWVARGLVLGSPSQEAT